ncbi:hypothetical protein QBC47DRAFT_402974 [Echria macrotheca]|uniref:Uncharacterized protein n=1 Tax=Echria macrotheca TaxID=438768 RepID=A0AAJ0FAW0_9PEZI|nr:hypothetical protein QBC47DRAFT_402974 [Echria macrotheca]
MRSIWSCSSCALLLLGAVLGRSVVEASHAGPERRRDVVHRVAKAQITPGPEVLLRKDGSSSSTCAADLSLCPDSLGGGCCPSRYECATDSCYATTTGATTACGKAGWFACPAEDSGGCCPVGYICGPNDCTPPAGVSNTITSCPSNYYLCPASVSFGCCLSGMGCALNACYSTSPVTSTVIQIATTTSGGSVFVTTQTAVTVAIPSPPSGLPTDVAGIAPKFIPSSVPKSPASAVPSGGGGGLTSAQVGGIVGGVVVLLIAVVVAAFLIIRRLNRVAEAVESSTKQPYSTSELPGGGPAAAGGSQMRQTYGYIDEHSSVDPLMAITPGHQTGGSGANTPPTGGGGGRARSGSKDTFTPSRSELSPDPRHPSMDSGRGGGGYFDIPPRVQNMPGGRQGMTAAGFRSSVDSHSTQGGGGYPGYSYHHARNQSNASELSDGSEHLGQHTPLVQELDSNGVWVELPTSTEGRDGPGTPGRSRAGSGVSMGLGSPRLLAGGRRRSESGGGGQPDPGVTGGGFGPLDVVNESAEIMHGYYGPRDRQVGQTAAGLGEIGWDVSSPVAVPGRFEQVGQGEGEGEVPPGGPSERGAEQGQAQGGGQQPGQGHTNQKQSGQGQTGPG